jgi:spore maturation protein CgeB
MKLVVLGLSLSSSWGNGHATTYRSLLKAFAARGHDIVFLERDVPWYRGPARDLTETAYCRLVFYDDFAGLQDHAGTIATADAVVVGSYVPEGIAVGEWVQRTARGVRAFYDIDTPVTLAAVEAGTCQYLTPALVPGYETYLSFTGGPTLEVLRRRYGSPDPRAFYCCADPELYSPYLGKARWDLSYLGTYSPDRQPVLERLLLEPARRAPELRFCVAGPQYPADIAWPENVERFEHVGPHDHREFYGVSRFTLNVTRADMVRAGYSPSVRLFEAAACGTPIVSDVWDGIDTVLTPGSSILLAQAPDDVLAALRKMPEQERLRLGEAARTAVLARHTAAHRAAELETALLEAAERRGRSPVQTL